MNQLFIDCHGKRKYDRHDRSSSSSSPPYVRPSSSMIRSQDHKHSNHQQNQTFDLLPVSTSNNISNSTSTKMMIHRNMLAQNYFLHLLRSENIDLLCENSHTPAVTTTSSSTTAAVVPDEGNKLLTSSLSPPKNSNNVLIEPPAYFTNKKVDPLSMSTSSSSSNPLVDPSPASLEKQGEQEGHGEGAQQDCNDGSKVSTAAVMNTDDTAGIFSDKHDFTTCEFTDKKEPKNNIISSSSSVSLSKCLMSFLQEASKLSLNELLSFSSTTACNPSQRHYHPHQTMPTRRTSFKFQKTMSGHPGVNEEFDLLLTPQDNGSYPQNSLPTLSYHENKKQPAVTMMKKNNFLLDMIISSHANSTTTNNITSSSLLSPSSPQHKSSKSSSCDLPKHDDDAESLLPPVEEAPPTNNHMNNKKRKRVTHNSSNNSSSDSLTSINPLDPSLPCFSVDFAEEYQKRLLGLIDLMKKTETSRVLIASSKQELERSKIYPTEELNKN
jgi:hypothetical protein